MECARARVTVPSGQRQNEDIHLNLLQHTINHFIGNGIAEWLCAVKKFAAERLQQPLFAIDRKFSRNIVYLMCVCLLAGIVIATDFQYFARPALHLPSTALALSATATAIRITADGNFYGDTSVLHI